MSDDFKDLYDTIQPGRAVSSPQQHLFVEGWGEDAGKCTVYIGKAQMCMQDEEAHRTKPLTLQQLKVYVADLEVRFHAEKMSWRGEQVGYEKAHLKGMQRAIELLEKGLVP